MSFTRKMLKAMGIEDDKIEQIMEAHLEVVDGLKEERNEYKESADKLDGVQKELDEANKKLSDENKESFKVKYEAIKEEYENYKTAQTEKETKASKETAYAELLKAIGISEKRIASILKVSDINSLELDENGKIKNAEDLKRSVKDEWADFIESKKTEGANVANPPANTGSGTMTKEQIANMKDPEKRQKAISENLNLFE